MVSPGSPLQGGISRHPEDDRRCTALSCDSCGLIDSREGDGRLSEEGERLQVADRSFLDVDCRNGQPHRDVLQGERISHSVAGYSVWFLAIRQRLREAESFRCLGHTGLRFLSLT